MSDVNKQLMLRARPSGIVTDDSFELVELPAAVPTSGQVLVRTPEVGLHYYQLLTTRRARMEGFLLYDFEDRFPEARRTLLGWYADGSLHVEHDVLEGLDNAPLGLRRLFDGGNLGKQILHVADPA